MTSQGWRPISVTSQPASVATHPEKVNAAKVQRSHAGGNALRSRRRLPHDRSSISTPTPTMTRNDQNTGATGGTSSPKALRPLTSPSSWCVRMSDAALGMLSAKSLRRSASLMTAKSTSGAPRSVCHSASMAAILAGWCASVLSPCRSPTTICSGTSTAASFAPKRSVFSAAASARSSSSRHAESPATRNAAVMPEASSMWVRR